MVTDKRGREFGDDHIINENGFAVKILKVESPKAAVTEEDIQEELLSFEREVHNNPVIPNSVTTQSNWISTVSYCLVFLVGSLFRLLWMALILTTLLRIADSMEKGTGVDVTVNVLAARKPPVTSKYFEILDRFIGTPHDAMI